MKSLRKQSRRTFLKNSTLIAGTCLAVPAFPARASTVKDPGFPLVDLHVHLTDKFTIEEAVEAAKQRHVQLGILDHPEKNWGLKNDADLKKYLAKLRQYPVYAGLQPIYCNWSQAFSPELLQQFDYILMDPQTVPQPDGTYLHIWEFNTHVPDTELFMEQYMAHSLQILNHEPINIFSWPLFLPVCIARDYYKLWTAERKQQIITAAKARGIAIELNEMAHVPDEGFIRMAREQGLKFSLGTDSRTKAGAARLEYCREMIEQCQLTEADFFVPKNSNRVRR